MAGSPIDLASCDPDALAAHFAGLVVAAGGISMEVFSRATIDARIKSDKSPVSDADERVEDFLLRELARDLPGVASIAEEAAARGEHVAHGDIFLLIDPIDGTREFLARGDDFTINLALVKDSAPFAGAVYAPARGRVWFGGALAFEAAAEPGGALPARENWRRLEARAFSPDGLVALVSKSHLDPQTTEFLVAHKIVRQLAMGSSIKFCLLANGEADVYPRFGPTMEWDTAAGDAVLRAAGGVTLNPDGTPLRYGKAEQGYRNGAFICWADPRAA